MHYDRWRGQWVGQAVPSTSGAADSTIPADAQAGTDAITGQNYQQALNSISSQINSTSTAQQSSSMPSTTTLVIGGIAALGLIWFLTRR